MTRVPSSVKSVREVWQDQGSLDGTVPKTSVPQTQGDFVFIIIRVITSHKTIFQRNISTTRSLVVPLLHFFSSRNKAGYRILEWHGNRLYVCLVPDRQRERYRRTSLKPSIDGETFTISFKVLFAFFVTREKSLEYVLDRVFRSF